MMMISGRIEWKAICARFDDLRRACELFYQSIQTYSQDSYGVSKNVLLPQAEVLYDCLKAYRHKYASNLPSQAIDALDRFLNESERVFKSPVPSGGFTRRLPVVQARLAALASVKSELEFCLSGLEDQIRTAAERAFLHLQRCIIADPDYRKRWKAAFKKGERVCEKLGAVHLLWHGVWAFKVSAEGGRTDLVMETRIDNSTEPSDVSVGLVLTEWKCSASKADAKEKYNEALRQASLYSRGILGGTELASPRYIVVVTDDFAPAISDNIEGNVTYRFINIAVDPSVPSRAARKSA